MPLFQFVYGIDSLGAYLIITEMNHGFYYFGKKTGLYVKNLVLSFFCDLIQDCRSNLRDKPVNYDYFELLHALVI